MFDGDVGRRSNLRKFFLQIGTRRNYRAEVVVVGRVHRSRGGYIGYLGSTVKHPGAMLSIHAVESVRELKPTAEDVARAPDLPFCAIAEGDVRLDGQLVRVKGSYFVVGYHFPSLASPTDENCGRPLSLSFDEEVRRFTHNDYKNFDVLDASIRDVTVVARVDLHRPLAQGQYRISLVVFAIDGVEPRK